MCERILISLTTTTRCEVQSITYGPCFEKLCKIVDDVFKNSDMKELLLNTHKYVEKHYDAHCERIWDNAKFKLYDSEDNRLCIKSGNGKYVIPVTKIDGKTNIVCTKNNQIVFEYKEEEAECT